MPSKPSNGVDCNNFRLVATRLWLDDFAYKINIEWWMFAVAGIIAIALAFATVSSQAIKAEKIILFKTYSQSLKQHHSQHFYPADKLATNFIQSMKWPLYPLNGRLKA